MAISALRRSAGSLLMAYRRMSVSTNLIGASRVCGTDPRATGAGSRTETGSAREVPRSGACGFGSHSGCGELVEGPGHHRAHRSGKLRRAHPSPPVGLLGYRDCDIGHAVTLSQGGEVYRGGAFATPRGRLEEVASGLAERDYDSDRLITLAMVQVLGVERVRFQNLRCGDDRRIPVGNPILDRQLDGGDDERVVGGHSRNTRYSSISATASSGAIGLFIFLVTVTSNS